MQVRRLTAWTAIPLAATLGLAACNSDSADVNVNGTVSIEIAEPQHLVPSNTTEVSGAQVLAALYSPLVAFDARNQAVEQAAASVTSTPDQKVWTIALKPGYTFHNGEPVVADNYIDAWNYAAYYPNGQANGYFFSRVAGYDDLQSSDPDGDGPQRAPKPKRDKMSGLKKVDDLTFTVTLSDPFTEFKSMLNYTAFYPLPAAAWSSPGVLREDFEAAPIGQGAFQMKGEWEHDVKVEVQRYEAFPGVKPKVAGVEFRIYLQQSAAYADVTSDNLDVVRQIPTESITSAPTDLGNRFQRSSASQFQVLAFPTFQQEFSKPEVRRAISMAIDRDEIIRSIFKDSQTSARSFVSPVVTGYRDNTCGAYCEYDPKKAKDLYDSAGGPKTIQVSYNADGSHKDWVEATCNELKENLGVECTPTPEPQFADMLDKLDARQPLGIFRMGWVMDYPSMENYLGPLYTSKGSSNYYGYSNEEFDRLVKEGAAAPTLDESIRKYQQAEDILAQDMPVIPLRFAQNNFGFSTKVRNVEIDLYSRVNLTKIEAVG
jgi:peptide/nickel transport system substrate-binding protein/oligopeptide transport system substrate-binding protein